jgi:hypothetical protein
MNSLRGRLELLERQFVVSDDDRLLAILSRTIAGDSDARKELERAVAAGAGYRGLLEVAQIFLEGPAVGGSSVV